VPPGTARPLACPNPALATDLSEIRFRSNAYLRIVDEVRRFARDPHATLLIEGESGTGKTIIARDIHRRSPRAAGPFESVVLSALDDALASSELFGHVVGAFTDARYHRNGAFVLAHGGTLFLDEIGKASAAVQRKLLHAVEYGEIRPLGADRAQHVDARLVAATNVSLATEVEAGRFLPDLFARLETFTIRLPALRERRADIPVLVEHYVAQQAPRSGYGNQLPDVDPELMRALQRADWPYNLRQLHATVHRLLVEAEGASLVTLAHCRGTLAYLQHVAGTTEPMSDADIADAIGKSGGNVSRAARLLGVDRTTLYRRRRRIK
jgi:DNA-binding NtrC family response regulator